MEQQPKISIIVPVFNAARFLDRCFASFSAQTFRDFELILVDDGSSDDSVARCKAFAKSDERVRVVEKENGGAGSARNAGIELARGEYLAFIDADDWFEKEMFASLYERAKEGDFDVVFSGVNYYQQTGDGQTEYSRTQNIEKVAFFDQASCRENIMTFFPTTTIFDVPWNKLYKRSVAMDHGIRFTDIRRCQDAMFNLDFFDKINSAASVDEAFYNYMENTVDDVRRKFPKDYIDITIYYYTHLIARLTQWGVYQGDIKRHYDTSFVLSVYSTADRFDNPRWNLSKQQQKDYIKDCFCRKEVEDFLTSAQVRDDAQQILDIVKSKDVDRLMRRHNKEKRKEALRQNKLLIGIYRKLKG